jgi:hypothetical protein
MTDTAPISRDDIKQKLVDIKTEAVSEVDAKKNQALMIGGAVGLLLLILVFFLGRKGGLRKSTVIEIKRA